MSERGACDIEGCCPFTRSGGFHGEDCDDLGRGPCRMGRWAPAPARHAPDFTTPTLSDEDLLAVHESLEAVVSE